MVKVKICGITNLKDALLAAEEGADALGFIFTKSPRQVKPEDVKKIVLKLPPFVCKVGVFFEDKVTVVKEIMDYCDLNIVQLHGNVKKRYLKNFDHKAFRVFEMNKENVLEDIKQFSLPFFMLDFPKNGIQSYSLDWDVIKKASQLGKVILAGGLNLENIEDVIKNVSIYGVDVCRGVEKENGIKSPEKVKNFIRRIKKCNMQK
ncbi:MAG: phosphoribosylanthranilate isomerase [Candidatus Aminicenantaceae bacterium]